MAYHRRTNGCGFPSMVLKEQYFVFPMIIHQILFKSLHVCTCSEGRFLWQNAETLVREVVGDKFEACIPEISTYLVESIGNDTRIDYGSGKK